MKPLTSLMRFVSALLVGAVMALCAVAQPALAATQNQASYADVQPMVLHISGQYTASTTAVARLQLPFRAKLLGVSASARASGGTSPTLTVDVQEAGVTVLSAPIAVTAGAVTEGTVVDDDLADESIITVNLAIGGTSPTWNDIVVLITVLRY